MLAERYLGTRSDKGLKNHSSLSQTTQEPEVGVSHEDITAAVDAAGGAAANERKRHKPCPLPEGFHQTEPELSLNLCNQPQRSRLR